MRNPFSQWLAAALVLLASASASNAQTVIPYNDGDNNAAPIVLVDPAGTVLQVIVGGAEQSGAISGAALLLVVKTGAGTLTLSNANVNLFADVSIDAGTLAIGTSTSLGVGLVTLNGGALQAAANGLNIGNDFAIDTTGGAIDTNGKTLTILGDIFDGNGPGGALTKTGAGTLVLDGFNDYSGATNILQGRVLATDDFALSENSAFRVNKGASLEVGDGVFAEIGSLADGPLGGGAVKIGAADPSTFLRIGLDDKDTTFSGIITGAGSLEKTGKGIQTLTGKGSSLGGVLSVCDCLGEGGLDIAGGSFKVGIGVFVLNSQLSVTKGGLLEQTIPFGILNFDSGKLLVDGAGSKILVAGLTRIGGFAGDAALVIQNGGKMESKGGADMASPVGKAASALVTGAGSIWNVDNDLFIGCFCTPATLTIADGGLVNSTGFTLIDVGSTLKLGLGGLAGSIVTKKIENDGFIKADFTDTSTLAAIISGPGTLTKDGSGKLILSGKSTYTGNTIVDGGVLSVNGSIANSLVKVNDGGTLGGIGIAGTTIVNDGGAIAPGNSVGTLTVKNSLTFANGSTYNVEVGTMADRTNVIAGTGPGNAVLSGGAVEAAFLSAGTLQKRYVILNAVGGLGGTKFKGVTDNAPGIVTSLSYDPSNVYLDNRLALSQLSGLTINQRNVADALDKFFDVNGSIDNAFATLDPAGLTLASGELATGAMQSGFESSDRFLDVISDRFVFADGSGEGGAAPAAYADEGASGPAASGAYAALLDKQASHDVAAAFGNPWKVWGAAYGGASNVDGDAAVVGSHDLDTDVYGIAAGAGWRLGDVAFGAALGGGHASFDLDGGLGSGDEGLFNAGIHGRAEFGAAYLLGALAYGYHDVSTSRVVGADTLEASYGAHSFSGRAEAGYRFDTPVIGLAPYLAFQGTSLRIPSYSETASGAGTFALDYDGRTATSARGELGVRLDKTVMLDDAMLMKLTGRAAWAHSSDNDRSITAGFQALPGTSFTVFGASPDRDSALLDLGAELAWQNGVAASVSFQSKLSQNSQSYAGFAKLSVKW